MVMNSFKLSLMPLLTLMATQHPTMLKSAKSKITRMVMVMMIMLMLPLMLIMMMVMVLMVVVVVMVMELVMVMMMMMLEMVLMVTAMIMRVKQNTRKQSYIHIYTCMSYDDN